MSFSAPGEDRFAPTQPSPGRLRKFLCCLPPALAPFEATLRRPRVTPVLTKGASGFAQGTTPRREVTPHFARETRFAPQMTHPSPLVAPPLPKGTAHLGPVPLFLSQVTHHQPLVMRPQPLVTRPQSLVMRPQPLVTPLGPRKTRFLIKKTHFGRFTPRLTTGKPLSASEDHSLQRRLQDAAAPIPPRRHPDNPPSTL